MTDSETTYDDWARIRAFFDEAIELDDEARKAYLDRACANEPSLRAAVESLLAADGESTGFMDSPLLPRPGHADDARPPNPGDPSRSTSADPLIDQTIGHYRILRRIGQGGMSTVYMAVQDGDAFKRRVVFKLVRGDRQDANLERRLRTERWILAGLDHPHIARLFDGGTTDDGRPYFVMEHVDGIHVDTYANTHQLSIDERLTLFRKICSAVQYAHQNLIVHRDIKPSNILVTAEGEPKLLDFGIAKILNPDIASQDLEATATWLRLMTPQYASPEQVRGRLVTTTSDVYSLGVLLYQLLTDRLPFDFERCSPGDIERILTEHDPPRPSTAVSKASEHTTTNGGRSTTSDELARARCLRPRELRQHLAGDLDSIVLKALRSAPQRRYATVEQFAQDVERFQGGHPVEARHGSWRYRFGKLLRRNRAAAIATALLAIVVIGAVLGLVRQNNQVIRERDQARAERAQREAVLAFFLDVLRVADPEVSNGAAFTVREALEGSRPKLRQRIGEQPAMVAEILNTTGTIYNNLGLWRRARQDLEEALLLRRRLYGEQHPDVAATLGQLGLVLGELGDGDQAKQMTSEALATLRDLELSDRAESLPVLNQFVTVLCYYGEYAAAEQPGSEAVELARSPTAKPEDAAAAIYNRGVIHLRLREPEEAARAFADSYELMAVYKGEDDISLAAPLSNLGSSRRQAGDLVGAEEAFRRALTLQRRVLGPDHPALIITSNNLARVFLERGEYDQSIDLLQDARRILVAQSGEQHKNVLRLDLHIADGHLGKGEAQHVAGAFRRSLPDWRETLGATHPFVIQGELIFSKALIQLGRLDEAEPMLAASFERALEAEDARGAQGAFELLQTVYPAALAAEKLAPLERALADLGG